MDFDDLRDANRVRQAEWPGNEKADMPFRAIEFSGEAGELMEAIKKHLRGVRGIEGSDASLADVADEMGDVLICLDLLADEMGIDLSEAVILKFNKTSRKYGFQTALNVRGEVMK